MNKNKWYQHNSVFNLTKKKKTQSAITYSIWLKPGVNRRGVRADALHSARTAGFYGTLNVCEHGFSITGIPIINNIFVFIGGGLRERGYIVLI